MPGFVRVYAVVWKMSALDLVALLVVVVVAGEEHRPASMRYVSSRLTVFVRFRLVVLGDVARQQTLGELVRRQRAVESSRRTPACYRADREGCW